jgi:hypothetical protein
LLKRGSPTWLYPAKTEVLLEVMGKKRRPPLNADFLITAECKSSLSPEMITAFLQPGILQTC